MLTYQWLGFYAMGTNDNGRQMNTGKHYAKAPIVEAVLAIQFKDSSTSLDSLAKCGNRIRLDYPTKKDLHYSTGRIELGAKSSATTTSEPIGFSWTSDDEKRIFQAKRDGFAFSLLAPYTTWHEFSTEAKRLWDVYQKTVKSKKNYARIALRYINRIDFPSPSIEMSEYFNIYTFIPNTLPQVLRSFFFQLTMPLADPRSMVDIVQTLVPPPPEKRGYTSVLFDIDIYRTESIPMGENVWEAFGELATQKSDLFEKCITQKTREIIGEVTN